MLLRKSDFVLKKLSAIVRLIFLLPAVIIPKFSTGQEITMVETLAYINQKIAPSCSIDVNKGAILAVYKDGGQMVREDEVNISDLDMNTMKYDFTEKMFAINCKGGPSKKCVSRELPLLEVYRGYARISFEVNLDEKGANGLKKAFTHMMRLVMEPKYKSEEAFE